MEKNFDYHRNYYLQLISNMRIYVKLKQFSYRFKYVLMFPIIHTESRTDNQQ